jgi:hypothetical protein
LHPELFGVRPQSAFASAVVDQGPQFVVHGQELEDTGSSLVSRLYAGSTTTGTEYLLFTLTIALVNKSGLSRVGDASHTTFQTEFSY